MLTPGNEHDVRVSARSSTPHGPPTASPPPARRPASATWRDPRLIVGVAIVTGSVLLGVKLFNDADDTVSVWAASADLRSGTTVGTTDVERHDIGFANPDGADRYLSADSPLPAGTTLLRDVGAGELLPRAALAAAGSSSLVEVPLAVAADAVPATVAAGSVVDVWVTPDIAGGVDEAESILVFDDVVVVAAPQPGSALGPTSTRQIIVGVDPGQEDGLAEALARAATGSTVITKQG